VDEPQDADPDAPSLADVLQETGSRQDEVIATLEQLLGDLSQWDNYRRIAREVTRLRTSQQQLQQSTNQIRLETLGTDLQDLEPQQRGELKRLALQQLELARQFDKIHSRMEKMQQDLREQDPVAAETLSDAQEVARQLAISAQMRESGRHIERNRVGQAADMQNRIDQHLKDLVDTLTNRREHELERRLRKLEEAVDALKQLHDKQQDIRTRAQQAGQNADPQQKQRELERLAREQQQLAEQARRLARQLQRLRAERPAETLEQAAAQQEQSAQGGREGDAQKTLEHAQEAERQLRQAQQQLEEERQEARRKLLHEQMARLEQELTGLIRRQQRLLAVTEELDGMRQQQEGQLSDEQLASVLNLAVDQQTLRRDAAELKGKMVQSKPFSLALNGVLREMDRAAAGLDQAVTGPPTRTAQKRALARLRQMQQAVQEQNSKPNESPNSPPTDQGGNSPPPGDAIKRLAELKLLKMLQQEIQRRTSELESIRLESGSLTDEQSREVQQLAQEQGQLADLVFDLMQAIENNPEVKGPDGTDEDEAQPTESDESLDDQLLEDLMPESEL
jgi:hypothetical protein